jgi:ComF family protein
LDCKSLWDFALEWILIPFSYSWFLKKIVLKLKYYHKKDVVDFLVDRVCLAIYANHTLSAKIEKWNVIVSWIPSHWHRRYFVKWYNQSFLLAQDLAKKLNLQYWEFLKKTKKTKSQASLDRQWRLKNLKNAFDFKNEKLLENIQTIILVDDVTTTWSTMNEVAKFIKSKYPKITVRWIVLCRKSN